MKKIIFVARALWVGGVEISLINLLNRMDFNNYDVTCLITEQDLTLAPRLDSRVHLVVCDRCNQEYKYSKISGLAEIPTHPSKLHRAFLWAKPIFKIIDSRLYARWVSGILNEKYDIAIIYDVYVAEFTARAVKADKYFMFYHHGALGHAYHDIIGYRISEKIIVVSRILCEQLKEKNPKYREKMITVHNIVDVKRIIDGAKEECVDMDSSAFNIVSCGRLSKEKGMDIAIAVGRNLIEQGISNFRWYIIGDGREYQNLRNQIKELHVEDTVFLLGEKLNPYPYIKKADLFVQTSRVEAYGITIVEALVLGTPVVGTKTAGARDVLENGKNGVLSGFDIEDIAAQIRMLMEDQNIYKRYKSAAIQLDFEKKNARSLKMLDDLWK